MMRIIPSLDGSLFKYYAASDNNNNNKKYTNSNGKIDANRDYLERIPFNMEDLLKTSVKLNKQITFIGGVLTSTLGIDSKTGLVSDILSSLSVHL